MARDNFYVFEINLIKFTLQQDERWKRFIDYCKKNKAIVHSRMDRAPREINFNRGINRLNNFNKNDRSASSENNFRPKQNQWRGNNNFPQKVNNQQRALQNENWGHFNKYLNVRQPRGGRNNRPRHVNKDFMQQFKNLDIASTSKRSDPNSQE